MTRMGFDKKWINLVMLCVKTIYFSVIINGETMGPINPSRGLKQGDPLSPYLFLLYTKGLITLLHQARKHRQISGIKICRGTPLVNHLCIDDCLLFFKANLHENLAVQSLLETYERASG